MQKLNKRKQSVIAGGLISTAGIFLRNFSVCFMQFRLIPYWAVA